MANRSKDKSEADEIVALAERALRQLILDPSERGEAIERAEALPSDVRQALDSLVAKTDSYRDGLLTTLAVPLVRGERVDVRVRTESGRTASDRMGGMLRRLHIKGVVSSFQNVGKNTTMLVRGNNAAWDRALTWAAEEATLADVEVAYRRVLAAVAATARTVLPAPRMRPAQLTFARVMSLLSIMFGEPTAGAHEQYVLAALLEALAGQEGRGLRVETKALTASDRSAGTGGDIEVLARGRLQEGIEVSANRWDTKLDQAEQAIVDYGLQRAHIVAPAEGADLYDRLLEATDRDVSVLDPLAAAAALVAMLDRRSREWALSRLYDRLDQHLASPVLVNRFVRRLWERGLAEQGEDIPGAP